MPGAPGPHLIGEGAGEQFSDVVVVAVARHRGVRLRKVPEQLRQRVQHLGLVTVLVAFFQQRRPGQDHVLGGIGGAETALVCELRFVGEDAGNSAPEMLAHRVQVTFVRDLDEALDGRWTERIHIGLVVEPGGGESCFQIGVPDGPPGLGGLFIHQATVTRQLTPPEFDLVTGQQGAVAGAPRKSSGNQRRLAFQTVIGPGRKQQVACPEGRVTGHNPASSAGWPAVLVIQPELQTQTPGVLHGCPDMAHECLAQVSGHEASPGVDEGPAQAHLPEYVELMKQRRVLQAAVPGPEGGAAVLGGRVPEQGQVKPCGTASRVEVGRCPVLVTGCGRVHALTAPLLRPST